MKRLRALPPRLEFAIVVLGAFGYFMLGSILAVVFPSQPQPISDADLQFLLIYESIALILLVVFLYIQRWPLQLLGVTPTFRGTLIGIGLAMLSYLAYFPCSGRRTLSSPRLSAWERRARSLLQA